MDEGFVPEKVQDIYADAIKPLILRIGIEGVTDHSKKCFNGTQT